LATHGIPELRDDALKGGEESPRDCFAPEHIEPTGMSDQVRFANDRGKRAQSLGIARIELVWPAYEGGDTNA
jgi:hypothetical protein